MGWRALRRVLRRALRRHINSHRHLGGELVVAETTWARRGTVDQRQYQDQD
jgi:hypothetical protein